MRPQTPPVEPAVGIDVPRQPARLVGIDVARAVAVVGMLLVNSGPKDLEGAATTAWTLAHGRASLLFVLLAGVGMTFLTRRRRGRDLVGVLLWRAALLLALGVLLGMLDHRAQVILPTYAVLFLLALGLVHVRSRWLALLSASLALLGPLAVLLVLQATGREYVRDDAGAAPDLLDTLDRLVLTGPYPLVTWTAPFVLGLALGRLDLGATRVQRALVLAGTGGALASIGLSVLLVAELGLPTSPAGFDHLVLMTAHSQMPLWLVGGTAAAVAVLGLCLLAAGARASWLWPLVATGRLALTLYATHLVVLHLVPERPHLHTFGLEVPLAVMMTSGAVLLAVLWTGLRRDAGPGPVGPLERLMRPPWEQRQTVST
ncbi:heparan-alpha-glucosaminide N-acetyltransferase domain-containing protein [Actinotalea sp. C106]|uniref:heparan-alpha-glucosaminide N-acetyltransferase domain-containing protein n=1 Tax=Actinotalea sp. C106 TaxID=2908644 RepID=UPI00202810EB|nr:heparan-alpha-glucosaminide N-acetyltransferase domain-containing protein [Actinotalea sp. C106]